MDASVQGTQRTVDRVVGELGPMTCQGASSFWQLQNIIRSVFEAARLCRLRVSRSRPGCRRLAVPSEIRRGAAQVYRLSRHKASGRFGEATLTAEQDVKCLQNGARGGFLSVAVAGAPWWVHVHMHCRGIALKPDASSDPIACDWHTRLCRRRLQLGR